MKIKFPSRENNPFFLVLNENKEGHENTQNDIDLNQKNFENQNAEYKNCFDKNSIVLIGANGSGKTRLSVWIDKQNIKFHVHRISAQKSLELPNYTQPIDKEKAKEILIYGREMNNWEEGVLKNNQGDRLNEIKFGSKWSDAPETHELRDINHLMQFLVSDDQLESSKVYDVFLDDPKKLSNNSSENHLSILRKVKALWEKVVLHKVIKIESGKILVQSRDCTNSNELYNGHEMSDGERAVFYFIGQVLSASKDSLIIIDEPENHLHNSIISRLWNLLEEARPDCVFLYITHNLDFALRSKRSVLIWVKDMPSKDMWNYEFINEDDDDKFDSLQLQMLGCREKIVLVEGNENSYDCKIYSALFPNCKIIPVESCAKVKELVRTFNSKSSKFFRKDAVQVYGIVDRDRMDDSEVAKLNNDKILVLNVAEIENVFLLPKVIEEVSKNQRKNATSVLKALQNKVIDLLSKNLINQCNLQFKSKLQNMIEEHLLNKKNKENRKLDEVYQQLFENFIFDKTFETEFSLIKRYLESIIKDNDYDRALRIFNNKGLLRDSNLCKDLGLEVFGYREISIALLRENNNLVDYVIEYIFDNQDILTILR